MTILICVSDFWYDCYYYEINRQNYNVVPLQRRPLGKAYRAAHKRLLQTGATRNRGGMEANVETQAKRLDEMPSKKDDGIITTKPYTSNANTACRKRITLRRLYLHIDAISAFYIMRELVHFTKFRQWLDARLSGQLPQQKQFEQHTELLRPDDDVVDLVWWQLIPPEKQIIDYKWNDMISHSIWEHIEVEYLMSWLSTLGGGYSALGEQFERCAETAGKISLKQLSIGMRLGDPFLQARCKLYYSISLIQCGHLRAAKRIIRAQYAFARQHRSVDQRLVNMCRGIWLRLRYEYAQRKAHTGASGDGTPK